MSQKKKSALQIELESKIAKLESEIESIEQKAFERTEKLQSKLQHFAKSLKYEIRDQEK